MGRKVHDLDIVFYDFEKTKLGILMGKCFDSRDSAEDFFYIHDPSLPEGEQDFKVSAKQCSLAEEGPRLKNYSEMSARELNGAFQALEKALNGIRVSNRSNFQVSLKADE